MKRNILIAAICFLTTISFLGQIPSGDEILKRVDANLVIDEAVTTATMLIHGRTGTRTIKSRSWNKGRDNTFVEYLSPAREKGKKMLKLGDKLWNYIPEPNDRIITISGHLLRQSVMGSDLSYEDMMENDKLVDTYEAKVIDSEEINGKDCYILELIAKEKEVTYQSRRIWVDKKLWLPIKEELYAKSGKLLKKIEILEVFKIDNGWYPKRMTFKDMLSRGEGTEYIIESINFDVDIPDYKFTKAALRK